MVGSVSGEQGRRSRSCANEDHGIDICTFGRCPWCQEEPTDALGPCGCTDYHMADCPLVTERFAGQDPPEPDEEGRWG